MSVHVSTDGAVTTVVIDRPEVRNAVDRPTAQALFDAFVAFDDDDTQAVAVLTGGSGTFCAGADLQAISDGRGNLVLPMDPAADPGSDPNPAPRQLGPMGPTRLQLAKPVIAAVEGYAVAGGLELALWCDLRVAAETATFGVFCRRWGVPLIDGGTVRLPRVVGHGRAMDMILTGRPVGADEALEWGLANRVCAEGDALATARSLADQLVALPPVCMRSDRRSALDQWSLGEWDALAREVDLGMATIRTGETLEGASRFRSGAGRHGSFEG